ncbi:WD repeat-containing protein 27 like protein [Aduncisulcus paluster]|uniref:WD repeat-containing protein 27 like protein n=1 Tax=Aduncisulcus paluster TaxID=2918883 RepID=A0ABQ5K1Y0_9EUKA|nr:WD repeat-containing protein 27 like protein [Aduncisulcus paluster]
MLFQSVRELLCEHKVLQIEYVKEYVIALLESGSVKCWNLALTDSPPIHLETGFDVRATSSCKLHVAPFQGALGVAVSVFITGLKGIQFLLTRQSFLVDVPPSIIKFDGSDLFTSAESIGIKCLIQSYTGDLVVISCKSEIMVFQGYQPNSLSDPTSSTFPTLPHDVKSTVPLFLLRAHSSPIIHLAMVCHVLLSVSLDGCIHIWDLDKGKLNVRIPCERGIVTHIFSDIMAQKHIDDTLLEKQLFLAPSVDMPPPPSEEELYSNFQSVLIIICIGSKIKAVRLSRRGIVTTSEFNILPQIQDLFYGLIDRPIYSPSPIGQYGVGVDPHTPRSVYSKAPDARTPVVLDARPHVMKTYVPVVSQPDQHQGGGGQGGSSSSSDAGAGGWQLPDDIVTIRGGVFLGKGEKICVWGDMFFAIVNVATNAIENTFINIISDQTSSPLKSIYRLLSIDYVIRGTTSKIPLAFVKYPKHISQVSQDDPTIEHEEDGEQGKLDADIPSVHTDDCVVCVGMLDLASSIAVKAQHQQLSADLFHPPVEAGLQTGIMPGESVILPASSYHPHSPMSTPEGRPRGEDVISMERRSDAQPSMGDHPSSSSSSSSFLAGGGISMVVLDPPEDSFLSKALALNPHVKPKKKHSYAYSHHMHHGYSSSSFSTSSASSTKRIAKMPVTFHSNIKSSGYGGGPDRYSGYSINRTSVRKSSKISPSRSVSSAGSESERGSSSPSNNFKQCFSTSLSVSTPCVEFSPSSNSVCVGSTDGFVRVIKGVRQFSESSSSSSSSASPSPSSSSAVSPSHISVLGHHSSPVHSIRWAMSGSLVLSSCSESICMWRVGGSAEGKTDSTRLMLKMHGRNRSGDVSNPDNPALTSISCARFFVKDNIIAASSGSSVLLYKYAIQTISSEDLLRFGDLKRNKYKLIKQVSFPSHSVTTFSCINYHPSPFLCVATSDKAIRIYDLQKDREVLCFDRAHSRPAHTIQNPLLPPAHPPSPAAFNLFVSASCDGSVKLWDVRAAKLVRTFTQHVNRSHKCGCAFDLTATRLCVGSENGSAYVYDIGSGAVLSRLRPHKDAVLGVDWRSPGIVTSGVDATIRLFRELD